MSWLILFDSIHHVLAAEAAFKQQGLWCDVVPVPRPLSSDCGMALAFRPAELDAVRNVLRRPEIGRHRLYRSNPDGYERLVEDGV
jgi:hypothetical protein